MPPPLILASGSSIRRTLLMNAGVQLQVETSQIDEDALRVRRPKTDPAETALYLARQKAADVSTRRPEGYVLGCDQVLWFDGQILTKPRNPEHAVEQLLQLSGNQHQLFTGAVIHQNQKEIWHHLGTVALEMHDLSEGYVRGYAARNWDDIKHCVGGYMIEGESARFFKAVKGDYFHVLGLPLIETLSYLSSVGVIER